MHLWHRHTIKHDVIVLAMLLRVLKDIKCFNVKCIKGTLIKMRPPETSLCTYEFSNSIF